MTSTELNIIRDCTHHERARAVEKYTLYSHENKTLIVETFSEQHGRYDGGTMPEVFMHSTDLGEAMRSLRCL